MDIEMIRLKAKVDYLDGRVDTVYESLSSKKDKMLPSTKLMLAILLGTITTGSALIIGFVIGRFI